MNFGSVVRHDPADALGEKPGQLGHLCLDPFNGIQRICSGCQANGDRGSRLSVDACGPVVVLCAKLHARHVFYAQRGAIRIGAHDDVAELLGCGKSAFGDDDRIELLSGRRWQLPQFAGCKLGILCAHCIGHICGRKIIDMQLFHLQPQTHRVFGTEQQCLAHARHTLDTVEHIGSGKAAQRDIVEALVRREQRNEHHIVARRFGHGDAQATDLIGQACLRALDAVLRFDRRQVKIRSRLERQRDAAGSQLGGGFHVEQMLDAVHFLLYQCHRCFFDDLRRCARVVDSNRQCGWRNRRVLRNRQVFQCQYPAQQDDERDHPRENRTVDKEFCEHV